MPTKNSDKNDNNNNNDETLATILKDKSNIYELYQDDFLDGTYRIKKAGTYVIMQDIIFDFNAGTSDDPNNDNAWWPHISQSDEYPGTNDMRDPYFMGFWAGITIESDNVILDLNGKTISMSKSFYFQQRFFTNIGIECQPFNTDEGFGFFGTDPVFPKDVTIKNGIIGLSSHHGIHGMKNENLKLENLWIKDFETHGIQLNGFINLEMKDIEIGPSSKIAFLNGEYAHGKYTLRRLKMIINDIENNNGISDTGKTSTKIQFYDRDEIDLYDLVDNLNLELDLAFNYVVYNIIPNYENDNELEQHWISSKKVFINENGLPYGASMYGIFLNYPHANVFRFHGATSTAEGATIENIYIHDIEHSTQETVRIDLPGQPLTNPYFGGYDVYALFGEDQVMQISSYATDPNNDAIRTTWMRLGLTYVGNILTDSTIAIKYFSDDWGYNQAQYFPSALVEWATGKSTWNQPKASFGCNGDIMTHSSKGTMGIRIDTCNDIIMENIRIDNIIEKSPLGNIVCGEYIAAESMGGGHFTQQLPYQIGYSGNNAQGIVMDWTNIIAKDISISNIYSNTGLSFGIVHYVGVEIILSGYAKFENIKAGKIIDQDNNDLTTSTLPNRSPEACAIKMYDSWWDGISTLEFNDDLILSTKCIDGHVGCEGVKNYYSRYDNEVESINLDCNGNELIQPDVPSDYQDEDLLTLIYEKLGDMGMDNPVDVVANDNVDNELDNIINENINSVVVLKDEQLLDNNQNKEIRSKDDEMNDFNGARSHIKESKQLSNEQIKTLEDILVEEKEAKKLNYEREEFINVKEKSNGLSMKTNSHTFDSFIGDLFGVSSSIITTFILLSICILTPCIIYCKYWICQNKLKRGQKAAHQFGFGGDVGANLWSDYVKLNAKNNNDIKIHNNNNYKNNKIAFGTDSDSENETDRFISKHQSSFSISVKHDHYGSI